MLLHPVTNTKILHTKYYQHERKFKGAYSRNKLSKIKGEAYIINLDDYE